MRRNDFIKLAGGAAFAAAGPLIGAEAPVRKKHLVTLSFDDGFKKSFVRTAEIYEKFGLSGCFNVTAAGHRPEVGIKDDYIHPGQIGDFTLWNELQARGHEIMPHGYKHAHLDQLPLAEAQKLVSDCLEIFTQELKGFKADRAVFNFPYNASTPELEAWLPEKVLAWRCHGAMVNPLPHKGMRKIGTGGCGPENGEACIDEQIKDLLSQPEGWLVYNCHGLDDEGWGPIGATYLEKLLERLSKIDTVQIVPCARALWQAGT